jgi:hypothetical protein
MEQCTVVAFGVFWYTITITVGIPIEYIVKIIIYVQYKN